MKRIYGPENIEKRFFAKVDKLENGCWRWTAHCDPGGYAVFRREDSSRVIGHRWAYERWVGPIPAGLHIDHLCRNRWCVNPEHLEPVTPRENVMRGIAPAVALAARSHCNNGHPFDEANTLRRSDNGSRSCRICAAAASKRSSERKRALVEQGGQAT